MIRLTTAKDRYDKGLARKRVSWDALAERLQKFKVTSETFAEYMAAGNDQLAIKDVGWYIGGPMKPLKRRKANLLYRSILTLDADHLTQWDIDHLLDVYRSFGFEFVWHSSHKHCTDEPRLRLIFPFSQDVLVDDYEPIARKVASWAGMDYFDDTTYQVSRVMFWPSRSVDGEEVSGRCSGKHLPPDFVLGQYEDSADWGEWPHSSREEKVSRDPSKKAEDPYTKPGVIGAFNRLYSVPHAIAEWELPYEPSGMGEDRYSFSGGTSVDGAIYYEDDGHLYSWHESDPARGNHNAFDLVRLHRFGDLDAGADSATPIGSRESQKAMVAFAGEIPDIQQELIAGDFDDLTLEDDDVDGKPKKPKLTAEAIRKSIDARTSPLTEKERLGYVTKIAAAKLTPAQVSILAAVLKIAHSDPAPSKQAILEEIKLVGKQLTAQVSTDGSISDIEEDLIGEVLREHFAGGEYIKRFGRQYWIFDSGVWRQAEDDFIYGRMLQTFLRLRKERPDDAMELAAAVGENKSSVLTSALARMLDRTLTIGDRDPLGLMASRDSIVNCLNGELHFMRNGKPEFTPHHPELFLTSQVQAEFDAQAKCPEWDRFCGLIFADSLEPDDMKRHLEELGGYLIQYTRWLKTWVLFHGPTNAGKTTVGKVFEALLGHASANRPMSAYDGRNSHSEAGLVGKLMLLDEDFAKGTLLPDGFIKKISEAKTITANPKGKDEFDFICRALPIVVANHWPPTRDVSDAFRERALVFDFLRGIPEAERDDERARVMIEEELPGILLRFVKGFKRLRKRGNWDIPGECVEARERWETHADSVRQWIDACTYQKSGAWIERPALYGYYTQWYRESNPGGRPLGKLEFLDRVGAVWGPVKTRSGKRGWSGREYRGDDFE